MKKYVLASLLLSPGSILAAIVGNSPAPSAYTPTTPIPASPITVATAPTTISTPPTPEQIQKFNALVAAQQTQAPIEQPTHNATPAAPPPPAAFIAQDENQEAFDSLLNQALPLTPAQIKKLRKLYEITEEAKFETPKAPPMPMSSSTRVNLDPGNTPPLIRLSAGFVSSLVFIDSTGAPWPIASYGIGDPQAFNIQWDKHSNTLFVQSLKLFSHGNLAVKLKDLDTPIMLSLVSGQKEVDFRVDLQIGSRGPQATAPIVQNSVTPESDINPILINFLDNVPPRGSTKLEAGKYGDAWVYKNKMYFRTKLKLLSPAWLGTVSSPNGIHVYEMMKTPLILASDEGKTVNISLKGL